MSRATAARRRAAAEFLERRSLLSGSLSGVVYDDLVADGHFEPPADAPLAGHTVELRPIAEGGYTGEVRTAVTGTDGRYGFDGLPDGRYNLQLVPTAGRFTTNPPPYGHGPTLPSTYPTDAFHFGTTAYGSVAGAVYHDADRDGTRDAGEAGSAGHVVFIDYDDDRRPGVSEPKTTTDATGSYRLDGLAPGLKRVGFIPADGWVRTAPAGTHTVRIVSGSDLAGPAFGAARRPAVAGLTLINPATDRPAGPLVHGATINLADFGGRINVRADLADGMAADDVQSVRFNLNGDPGFRVENAAPYALAGDTAGDYRAWRPRPGPHTLVVTAYTGDGAAGERGPAHLVTFNVVDAPPPSRPLRVNAGGRSYTTAAGDTFMSDHGFRAALPRSTPFEVAGTGDDALYYSHRFGRRMAFARSIPSGSYVLRLHFAEPTYAAAGRRVFDVYGEGRRLLDDYDLAADAGRRTAVVKQFPVTVSDNRLDLSFVASRDAAVVSAVELIPAGATSSQPAPVYLDAGGADFFTDTLARPFEADRGAAGPAGGFVGGRAVAEAFDVEATPDDALYASHRAGGVFSLRRPVADGNYALLLGFAEPVAGAAPGARTFDVFAEGRRVLDDYDVVGAAGAARTAVAEAFEVSVADGALDLTFRGVAGEAVVSSVILIPTDVPDAAKPYSPERWGETARQVVSASNLRQIASGALFYAGNHRGRFAPDLASVVPYFNNIQPFASPRAATKLPRGELAPGAEQAAWVRGHDDYVYVGAGLTYRNINTHTPLAYENPRKVVGPINVAFADGHVELIPREDAAALLGFDPAAPSEPAPPPPDPRTPPYLPDPEVMASRDNLFTIGRAMQVFANEQRGNLPADLARLFETQDLTASHFLNPRDDTAPPPAGLGREELGQWVSRFGDYAYLGSGRSYSTPSDIAVAYEHPGEMAGGINILFADGRVEFREMRWAAETIRRSAAWTRWR